MLVLIQLLIGNLGTEPSAARAEVGLNPSASDAELAEVQAYIATPGRSAMKAWLLHIGVEETDFGNILLQFLTPEYGVKNLRAFFALEDEDIDEILKSLPLANSKLMKENIKQEQEGK